MNNEEVMRSDSLTALVCERNLGADANTEYTLPEYFPEIRKLLHVEQTITPPTKYVNSSSAQVHGNVDCRILYVGADGELYSAPVSTEYSVNMPIDVKDCIDSAQGLEMTCSVCGEGMSARVTGPRKISLRSRIRCMIRVMGSIKLSETLLGEVNPLSIYKNIEKTPTAEYCSGMSDLFEVDCEISPMGEGTRIADADAKIFVDDISLGNGAVNCRGEVLFRALQINEITGEHTNIMKKLRFESDIETDTELADACVRAYGTPCEIRVEVDEDRAVCKIGVMLEARCLANRVAEYTADVYSSERECQIKQEEYIGAEALICKNGNITLSERLSADDSGIPSDAQIITAFGNATLDSCKSAGEKYIFDGNTRFSVITLAEGEYACTEINIPFKYEADGIKEGEISGFDGVASVTSMRISNDGGQLAIDAELAISADCLGSNRIIAVSEAEFEGETERDENSLIVCYPAPDDTLWSVAKRYAVAPSKIIGDPKIDKYLIIE